MSTLTIDALDAFRPNAVAFTPADSIASLSPTPLTPSAHNSMWGAPTSSAGKFSVEMDEGGWMHTYHATVFKTGTGQNIQFRTSAVNTEQVTIPGGPASLGTVDMASLAVQ